MNLTSSPPSAPAPTLSAHLAAAVGLSEPLADGLVREGVPVIMHALATSSTRLGSLEVVWDTCRQFYLLGAHLHLAELTRTDGGWPAHRQELATALLGEGRLTALAQQYAPQAPEPAGQLLSCLVVMALATAGEHAAQEQLGAAALQQWLREQAAGQPAPASYPVAAPTMVPPAAPADSRPKSALGTTSVGRWPLLVLTVAGVGASAYFWQQLPEATKQVALQSVSTSHPATARPLASASPVAALIPAPVLPVVLASVSAAGPVPAAVAPAVAAPVAAPVAASPVPVPVAARAAARPAPATPAVAREEPTSSRAPRKPGAAALRAGSVADTVGNARQAASLGGEYDAEKGAYARDTDSPLLLKLAHRVTLKVGVNSSESLLYKRFANPSLSNEPPLYLDQLLFPTGLAELDPEGTQQLANIVSLLKTFPRYRLIVFGNAELTEPQPVMLAINRAQAVVLELMRLGIPSSALQAQGRLRTDPSRAADPDHRRRVSLAISSLD